MSIRSRVPWSVESRILSIESVQSEAVNRILARVAEGIPSAKILSIEANKITTGTLQAGEGIVVGGPNTGGLSAVGLTSGFSTTLGSKFVTASTTVSDSKLLLLALETRAGGVDDFALLKSITQPVLTDDFTGVTIDTGKWVVVGTSPTQNNELSVDCTTNYDGVTTAVASDFTFTDHQVTVKVVQPGDNSNVSGSETALLVVADGADQTELGLRIIKTTTWFLQATWRNSDGSVVGSQNLSFPYDETQPIWLRLREHLGFWYWEVSIDGVAFETVYSREAFIMPVDGCLAMLFTGAFASGTSTQDAIFDDFIVEFPPLEWKSQGAVYATTGGNKRKLALYSARTPAEYSYTGTFTIEFVQTADECLWSLSEVARVKESPNHGIAQVQTDVADVNTTTLQVPLETMADVTHRAFAVFANNANTGLTPATTFSEFHEVLGDSQTLVSFWNPNESNYPPPSVTAATSSIIRGLVVELDAESVGNEATIKSANYATGVSGWIIDGDGNAEFNNVVIRGSLINLPSGTAFPAGPQDGDLFLRTDEQITYRYDGTAATWWPIDYVGSSVRLANAVITTAKIGDAQVTNAKIASLSAAKITAGTITSQTITIGTAGKIQGTGGTWELNDDYARFGTTAAGNFIIDPAEFGSSVKLQANFNGGYWVNGGVTFELIFNSTGTQQVFFNRKSRSSDVVTAIPLLQYGTDGWITNSSFDASKLIVSPAFVDGTVALALNIERSWEFRQEGTGAGTDLRLASTSNKGLVIWSDTGASGIRILPSTPIITNATDADTGFGFAAANQVALFAGSTTNARLIVGVLATIPGADNSYGLGVSANRWTDVWAVDTTINSSARAEKKYIGNLGFDPGLLIDSLPARRFQRIGRKRWHWGWIADEVKDALEANELDPHKHGVYIEPAHAGEEGLEGLRTGELVPILWEEIRNLRARVAELERATT